MIYCKERLPEDFYPTGKGSSFVSAEGAANKYNLERLGELAFNCRVKAKRSTCYYLNGSSSYKGKQKKMFAHQVAFFLHHGYYPQWPNSIDHINRDGCDNRIINLREVTARQQSANTGMSKANTSGVKGVSFLKDKGKWRASMNVDGKKTNLGTFATIQEATAARKAAEKVIDP